MIRNIQRKYFEIWGTEEAQNYFLKGFLLVLGSLFLIQTIALTTLALRKPILVAMGNEETKIFTIKQPSQEILRDELTRTVKLYVETHYDWDNATIEKAHAEAAKYVGQKFVKAFIFANSEQVKIAKEKKLKQVVYVSNVQVDSKLLTARVTMDRILVIEGLRAVTPFVLDITFEYGPRTEINPEGIYVTGEKMITNS